MRNHNNELFAIYKNGTHLGNEHGIDVNDAIRKYIIASNYGSFIDDKQFVSLYSGKLAIKNIHFI